MIINNRCEALCPVWSRRAVELDISTGRVTKSNQIIIIVSSQCVCTRPRAPVLLHLLNLSLQWLSSGAKSLLLGHVFKFYTMMLVLFRRSSLFFVKVPRSTCIYALPWNLRHAGLGCSYQARIHFGYHGDIETFSPGLQSCSNGSRYNVRL